MKTRTEVIADVLKVLELAAPRSGMYMLNSKNVDGFRAGLHVMGSIFGLDVPKEAYVAVQVERGWLKEHDNLIFREFFLAHTKLTDNEIACELLTIELEAWRRTFGAELEGEAGS